MFIYRKQIRDWNSLENCCIAIPADECGLELSENGMIVSHLFDPLIQTKIYGSISKKTVCNVDKIKRKKNKPIDSAQSNRTTGKIV